MLSREAVAANSDSLAGILAAQCADLESLLGLTRREEAAARAGDFEAVAQVVSERAAVGSRLEAYHRQLAELRERLGEAADAELRGPAAQRASQLARQIQRLDSCSRIALGAALVSLRERLARVGSGHAALTAYMRDPRSAGGAGGAYDRRA